MSQPLLPFFCRSGTDQDTECFATRDEAEAAARTLNLYPYTVYQLLPHPVGFGRAKPQFQQTVKETA